MRTESEQERENRILSGFTQKYKADEARQIGKIFKSHFPKSTLPDQIKNWPVQLAQEMEFDLNMSEKQRKDFKKLRFRNEWKRQEVLEKMIEIVIEKNKTRGDQRRIRQKFGFRVRKLQQMTKAGLKKTYSNFRRQRNFRKK